MDSVKPRPPWTTSADGGTLAPVLMARLMKQVSRAAADAELGLRPSHFRLLSQLSDEGLRVSVLAEQLGMTTQSCGQFVTALVASGHVEVHRPPGDRRTKVVVRTDAGAAALAAFEQLVDDVETAWAARVGARRYATFRAVLGELVTR